MHISAGNSYRRDPDHVLCGIFKESQARDIWGDRMEENNLFKKYPGCYRIGLNLIFIILFISATGSKALAHKVNIFGYVEADTIFTESYFNDGRKCVDSRIEVFDSAGNKLLEGITNKTGEFSFKIPVKTDLKLVLTASMGHRAEYMMPASGLPGYDSLQVKQKAPEEGIVKQMEAEHAEIAQVDLEQIKSVVENTLDEKLKPLVKLIAKSQEHRVSVTEVIGGIGYIFGLMGVVIYFKNKKK
jgi:nickel transport protein